MNNAGILETGSIETSCLAQYDRVMGINVRSIYLLTSFAVPYLIKTCGCVVNVSSVCGIRSFPNVLAYCMSKSALDQFTRCTALELAPKQVSHYFILLIIYIPGPTNLFQSNISVINIFIYIYHIYEFENFYVDLNIFISRLKLISIN